MGSFASQLSSRIGDSMTANVEEGLPVQRYHDESVVGHHQLPL